MNLYKSDQIFAEIIKKFPFVDGENLKKSDDAELSKIAKQTGDDIFWRYAFARKVDEAEKKKRKNNFLQKKYGGL